MLEHTAVCSAYPPSAFMRSERQLTRMRDRTRYLSGMSRVGSSMENSIEIGPTTGRPACGKVNRYIVPYKSRRRQVNVHVPQLLCDTPESAPIVVAFHCLGCPPDYYTERLAPIAEQLLFTLVVPVGIERSWNAGACCGFALEHNIDDMGFVLKAVTTIQRLLGPLSSSAVFATGWSNGGFLATALGMMKDTPFKGVAPISGYQYSGFKEVPHVMPIFMHHSRDDPLVRYSGCCTNTTSSECCCGISQHGGDTCVDATSASLQWATHINGCSEASIEIFKEQVKDGVHCIAYTDCQARSTLCSYDEYGHFNSMAPFPMDIDVGIFFIREACEMNGTWNNTQKVCTCPQEVSGTYCLSHGQESG